MIPIIKFFFISLFFEVSFSFFLVTVYLIH
jgi:hypothetical protein